VRRGFGDQHAPDLIADLIKSGPESSLQYLHTEMKKPPSEEDSRFPRGLPRTLMSAAERTLRRKTIVCLPNGSAAWTRIAQNMAEEVHTLLDNPDFPYAFMQLAPDTISAKSGHDNKPPMDSLLEVLQSLVAEGALGRMPTGKPGPTLLEGETGTGKSFAAKLFSRRSGRSNFHPYNLSAVTPNLLESRLRGSVQGAFTDAKDLKGWLEEADNGILFLDELQSADISFQTQLLDLLDPSTNRIRASRIGSHTSYNLDVKVILAINEDIPSLLAEGRLRKDIFFRIRNIVRMPPLRTRLQQDESGRLMRTLLSIYRWRSAPPAKQSELRNLSTDKMARLFPQFSSAALNTLKCHTWPGNLREFERVSNDLYWDIDEGISADNHIDAQDVSRAIDIFNLDQLQSLQAPQNQIEQRRLQDVQAVLREHGFIIQPALEKLAAYKLKSRNALKAYLRKHRSMLARDLLADSRIKRFLGDVD